VLKAESKEGREWKEEERRGEKVSRREGRGVDKRRGKGTIGLTHGCLCLVSTLTATIQGHTSVKYFPFHSCTCS
jgi:hypothetical protein